MYVTHPDSKNIIVLKTNFLGCSILQHKSIEQKFLPLENCEGHIGRKMYKTEFFFLLTTPK